MLVLGMNAADLSVVLGQAFVGGIVLSLPFAAFVAAGQGVTAAAARGRRRARLRARERHGAGAEPRAAQPGGERGPEPRAEKPHAEKPHAEKPRAEGPRAEARPERRGHVFQPPGSDAFYAAQLRRAAPIVRLFAGASCEGEKEAAYQALVRLAAAINAARGAVSAAAPVTPAGLYRDLTREGNWTPPGAGAPVAAKSVHASGTMNAARRSADAMAFDARLCAELDRREAAPPTGKAGEAGPRRDATLRRWAPAR